MTSSVDQLSAAVRTAVKAGDFEGALRGLGTFVANFNSTSRFWGQVPDSPLLDGLCQEIASAMQAASPLPPVEAGDPAQVYVATALYAAGGHTLLLRDLIQLQPQRRHVLLLTDLVDPTKRDQIERILCSADGLEIAYSPGGSWAQTCLWLAGQLRTRHSSRVFLLSHQEDSPAIVAALMSHHPRLHFIHHADYTLTLGMHLPGSTHVDLTSYSYHQCRRSLDPKSLRYLPLSGPEACSRDPGWFQSAASDPAFVTCSSGGGKKFEMPYDFSYARIIPELLAKSAATHVHIGPLSDGFLANIRANCQELGVPESRFRHVAYVPNLAEAMAQHAVSLYLSSWPLGGAKSLIDVQASGTPVLGHISYRHPYFGVQCLLHPQAPVWREPAEFFHCITTLTPEELQRQSRLSREHWERENSPRRLAELLAPDELPETIPTPQAETKTDLLRCVLTNWDGELANSRTAQMAHSLEKRCRKLHEKLDRSQAALDKAKRRQEKAEREVAEIKDSVVWKAARFFVRQENSLRKRLRGRSAPGEATP